MTKKTDKPTPVTVDFSPEEYKTLFGGKKALRNAAKHEKVTVENKGIKELHPDNPEAHKFRLTIQPKAEIEGSKKVARAIKEALEKIKAERKAAPEKEVSPRQIRTIVDQFIDTTLNANKKAAALSLESLSEHFSHADKKAPNKKNKDKNAPNNLDAIRGLIHSNFDPESCRLTIGMGEDAVIIEPKNERQAEYMQSMLSDNPKTYQIGAGPAGTGKTFLAVAAAIHQFSSGHVDKIGLSRPPREAGKGMGALTGDEKQKMSVYLKPLNDALAELLPPEILNKMRGQHFIEEGSPNFFRGRTFKRTFVIIDEAQNTTEEEISMIATRPGEESIFAFCGDPNPKQIDINPGSRDESFSGAQLQKSFETAALKTTGLSYFLKIAPFMTTLHATQFLEQDSVRSTAVADFIRAERLYAESLKKKEPEGPSKTNIHPLPTGVTAQYIPSAHA